MGDTLAGMIAGFAGQFPQVSLYERVVVATYLHSAIAEDLSKEAYVVLPTTISQEIPKWMKKWRTIQTKMLKMKRFHDSMDERR